LRENEIFEGQGIGWWLEINGAFERLVSQMGKSGKQVPKPRGKIAPASALAYLEDASTMDLTLEYVDRAWKLAEEVSAEENNQERNKKWTEVLNELEMDTARFVLDGLVRKAVEDLNPSLSILDGVTEGPGYRMGAGRWTNLLELQDNEVALEHSKPYMLASSIRVYRFLRHLAASLSKQPARGKPQVQEPQFPLIYLTDQLRTSLANSSAARSLMGRDHGNTFGIWDMSSDDEGSEMLGWGAYVFGSYFNHG
jgi:SET and MYND domain-containing protein